MSKNDKNWYCSSLTTLHLRNLDAAKMHEEMNKEEIHRNVKKKREQKNSLDRQSFFFLGIR